MSWKPIDTAWRNQRTMEEVVKKNKGDGLCSGKTTDELALGYLRYEAVRKLSARGFADLCARNLKGERFDDMVDELVLKESK